MLKIIFNFSFLIFAKNKKKCMKKALFYITLIFIALFQLNCGAKKETNVIEFWTLQLSPAFDDYFHKLISRYEKENPGIKIKWIDIPYDAAIQKLMASAAAGNPPDVVNLSADFLAKFNGLNALADLTNYFPKDSFNIFLPNALENCVYDDKVIALPWYLNTYVLIYNKKFFKEAGFSENDVPRTFSGLVNFTRKYKDKTGNYALFWNIGKDSYLPMMLESEGVNMTNSEMTKAEFNSPEGIKLVDQWVRLYKDGYLPKESIIKPGSSIIEPYQSGQVAMVFTGPVSLKRIKDNAPKIYSETDVAPAVVGKTGNHELAVMVVSVMAGSENVKQAADFAFYVTNAENQLNFSKIETTYPSIKTALKDSFFTLNDGTLETRARIIGAKELNDAVRLREYLEHPQFDKLRDAFDEAVQNAALGKMSTKEALDEAAEKWNKILSGA